LKDKGKRQTEKAGSKIVANTINFSKEGKQADAALMIRIIKFCDFSHIGGKTRIRYLWRIKTLFLG